MDAPFGDPQMHHIFGARYFKEQQYYDAEHHFVHGTTDSAKLAGIMAFECITTFGTKASSDPAYFAARSVLQIAALCKIDDARIALDAFLALFKQSHPDAVLESVRLGSSGDLLPVYNSSLLNFLTLMFACLDRKAGDLYMNVVSTFTPQLSEDSFLLELAEIIGGAQFNVGPRQKQANPLSDMMKMMFSGSSGQAAGSKKQIDMD
eukprot:jgi/Hompol1/2820/HPOL_006191-RA